MAMTRKEAKEYVKANFGVTLGKNADSLVKEGCALVRLRHTNNCLPEIGVNGMPRDCCEWAFIDMCGEAAKAPPGGSLGRCRAKRRANGPPFQSFSNNSMLRFRMPFR